MTTLDETKTPDDAKIMVCDACLKATCWYGEFMCWDAVGAGLKVITVGEARKLNLEHEDYWSDEYLIKVYGDAKRDFRP